MIELEISLIRLDGGTQPRSELNIETVNDYAEAMKAGAIFPAVTIFFNGTDYWLADGFHRIAASKKICLIVVSVEVLQGDRRDAILYSTGVNATHGLRRSNEDKRRVVRTLLQDPEWSQWSDRKIAKTCGVSNRFVGNIRRELGVNGSHPTTSKRNTDDVIKVQKTAQHVESPEEQRSLTEPNQELTIPLRLIDSEISSHENDELLEYVDVDAITLPDDAEEDINQNLETQKSFSVGDRIRIIRREQGPDKKWTGKIAKIWEITDGGWLRVNVEGHKGVKFTLHPDWVVPFEKSEMTEQNKAATLSDSGSLEPEQAIQISISLIIEGELVQVEGVVHEVDVHYIHQGVARTARVPANHVVVAKSL
jgi:hypothetical protein